MMPRLSQQISRQVILGLLSCAFIALVIATTQINVGRGATPNLLPLPIEVPVPEEVIFTDGFADAMAIDGDILAVGAPNTTVDGNDGQGVVYLYMRDSVDPTAFTLFKTITGSSSVAHAAFGGSVGIHGDTLVVGTDTNTDNAVYVFERNQGGANNWGEVRTLVRGDSRTITHFGRSLAVHGDTIVVGDPLGLGEVFIFQRDEGGADQWGKTQTLDTGRPITSSIKVAAFGESIAFDGNKLVIGAPKLGLTAADVPNGAPVLPDNFVGAVSVYHEINGQWVPEAKLFSSDIVLNNTALLDDSFGKSLALNGDTLFIGASSGQTNGVFTGKVFVYQQGSGATPPYGQPEGWGEIVHLNPSDGVENDAFGTTLYAVDDALFVGSQKQGVGKVYFFQNPVGIASSNVAPQAMQLWGEVYSFSASTNGSSTAFGNPIIGSGNSVLFGDASAHDGGGGIYAYPKDALFAHDPNVTPTPSETPPTVTPSPDPVEPCVFIMPTQPTPTVEPTEQKQVYLPSIVGGIALANPGDSVAAIVTPNAPTALFADTLAPGCTLTTVDGVKVAAVEGAITQTIAVTVETTVAPPEPLPDGATPVGNYLRISSSYTKHVQMGTPFVIAIPVPTNVVTTHLVIANLLPATSTLDSETTGNLWGYLPGVYDAETNLFLASMPFLLADGATFVLVQHPDFESPPNQPLSSVQAASAEVFGGFRAFCIRDTFNNAGDCTEVMEALVEGMLDDIYLRMTNNHFFNFPGKLRLLDSGSQFIVSDTISATAENATYAAYIEGPKSKACKGADGYYNATLGYLALCPKSGNPIDDGEMKTLIHEFFHAIEYTFMEVLIDYDWGYDEAWIIEGMAQAAVESFPLTEMQRSPKYGGDNLRKVEPSLTQGEWGDNSLEEYLSQDFWVYMGLSEEKSLAYLGPLLFAGGATQFGMDDAFKTLYGKSLGEFYWGWVKHQTIENTHDLGGEYPGTACELTEESLSTGAPVNFPASEQFYPFDTQSAYDTLPPLSAKVIEIDFGAKTSALVTVEYQGCAGLQDSVAKATCVAVAQQDLRVKIYEEGEFNCHKDDLNGVTAEGIRQLTSISPDLRYFVVVANVDLQNDHGYFIAIE